MKGNNHFKLYLNWEPCKIFGINSHHNIEMSKEKVVWYSVLTLSVTVPGWTKMQEFVLEVVYSPSFCLTKENHEHTMLRNLRKIVKADSWKSWERMAYNVVRDSRVDNHGGKSDGSKLLLLISLPSNSHKISIHFEWQRLYKKY